jgi:hypothetical protein
MTALIEAAAGWVSLEDADYLAGKCRQEKVPPEKLCAFFGISCIYELQQEDLFNAFVFIGKNSKERF